MARKKDITETGPKALRGIRNPDLYSVSKDNPVDAALSDLDMEMLKSDLGKAAYRNYDVSTGHVGYSALQDPSLFEPQVTPLDYGSSKYDTGLLLNPDQGDIQDQRANSQSGFLKVVNGLAKGAVLAGTTFLDGTVGLVYGTGAAVNQGRWSALWDNDFSRAMQKINDVSEELMPNYYTQDEQQNPWDHIFSANFIGDKFIKNLGFTVGALYSGGVISGGVRGIGAAISTAKAFTKATAHVATGVGVFTSALNEGRIEAINNSRDWFNLHAMKLEDGYKQRIAVLREEYEANAGKNLVGDAEHGYVDPAYIKYQEGLRKEEKAYRAALTELNEKKLHMGNVDLLMNLPILMASNFVQFARFYANGFNTGRKVFNVLGDPGKYVAGTGKKRLAVELGKRGLAEGTEEISQRAASEISGDYYSTDVMNFYKSKTNREAEMETLDFMKSFATGINKTVNDGSAWEEFLIGALTGIMGVPKFRSMHNAQGKLQSPVTLYNESWEKWKENKKVRAEEAELVDALNTRFNSEDFLNYYQGLIRNKKFQIDMNRAIEEGDEFGFKNAEHAQLISDIIMFDKAGKLNDLKAAMDVVDDVSDENLESIIKNTTTKDDSGKLVGPFAQYASVDKETGEIVANFGSEQDKKDMATKLKENNKTITDTIKEYQKRKDKFVTRYGDKFTDDQLSELTWMNLQLDNWAKRAEEMAPAVKDELKHILGSLNEANRPNQELRDSEGREHADLTDLYRMFDSNVRNLSDLIQRVKSYTNLSDKSLARILTSNPKTAETFIKLIDRESDSVDKDDVVSKLRDMVKIGKAANTYAAKLSEYLKIPEKLAEDEKKADNEAVKQATTEAITNAKDALSKTTTPKEFRDAADTLKRENPEESDNINQAIQNLANEGNQQAKAYQDINQYIVDVNAALTAANLSSQTLSDASNILNTLASNSNNLEELMNPEAVVDDEMFLEEGVNSLEDAKNRNVAAQYALSKAKERVNNGNKFKDRFSAAYQTPTDNEKGTGTGVDEVTTGDSGTPTIPDTGGTTAPTRTEEVPIGNSSIDDIKKDNKELNDSVEDPVPPKRGEVKQYYRPAVPELHIEASKRGDFRPFNVVASSEEYHFLYIKRKLNSDEKALVDRYISEHPEEPKNVALIRKALSEKLAKGNTFLERILSEPIPNFDATYNYLVKNDVFKYLNEGNLHEDDELGFMIDPEFEREVEGKEWHKKPTIFIINKRDGHIVGSLDESEDSVKKFEGLKELEDRVIAEYNSKKSHLTSRFVATPTTKVSQIMIGKVPYSEDERNLKDVLETYMSSGKEVFFGIIKNGVLNTNGKVDSSKIMPLKDTSGKEGRLYLLVPNGANKYSPVAVRVKHFNAEEFNPADVNLQGNPIMNNIQNAIKALSEVTSKQELDNTVPTLAKVLYKGNLHIDFVDNAYGTGIRFTKIFRDSNGEEIYEVDSGGNRKRKEEVVTVDLTKKGNTIAVLGDDNQFHDVEPTQVPQEQVIKEITDTLLSFNLPIQISISDINTSSRYQGNVTRYNNGIIEAGLLTSNLTEMGTKSTWFTTDYFDAQGNPHKAINPVYKATPNNSTPSQGAINGVQITSASDDKMYFVDLQTNTIRDSEGKVIPTTDANSVLIDVAWAQKMYGDATEGVNMFNNKVITPSGKALDRTTQKYLDDSELQLLKQDIVDMQNRAELVEKANKILEKINEDQSKVDKARTDQEYYYILEDDGQYYPYERVHKALGPNWIGESTSTANSSRALVAGSAVDSVIRQYFMTDDPSTIQRPDKLTKGAFNKLLDALSKIKARMEANGERFFTNNIVLYYKYSDGRRVAGEVDILAINKNGRYSIYDVKTSARSFSHQYFTEKGSKQVVSTKDYYTLQLSAYQNLFESKYDSDIRELGIVPFVLGYFQNTDVVNTVVNEPDIPIIYNPNVNVPLVGTTQHNRPKDEVSTQNTPNKAQAAINALNLDQKSGSNENNESGESTEEDIFALRKATDSSYEVWNKEQELAWLEKVLPQLSREDRLQFVKGLIKVGNDGVYAWGKLDKGIVTLSDIAAKGTAYHEAFHVVFNYLMDENDREALLSEYSKKLPNTDNVELEEALAEDFREFVMQGGRDTRSLGRKIIDFFKSLFIKTKYWKDFRPSSIYYFKRINDSRYANGKFGINKNTRAMKVEYTQEMKDILAKAPRDAEGRLLAPNGKVSNLTERQYAQVRTKAFKNWFGDWEKVANITEEELQIVSLIFDRVPELAKIGTPNEYAAYIKEIFPNSVEKEVYWHGSNEDFSEGFSSAKRGEGSGALETKKRNDLYLNKQGWASIQYVDGINRKGRDKNGFGHWNKLWWELKEIMSNGRRENNDWKNIIIDESTIRQAIPNKKGVFNRDSGGKNGKWLSERKADYGYENKSDKEFFEEIFGIKLGKDTFNTWTARNAEIFKSLEKSAKGINPVVIDVRNPIIEEGQNTYYEEQRGLFTIANAKGNDAILSKKADNEFNSDVAVVINANNDNVYWLGTKSDIERFRQWKTNNNASKVVDENGEPLVVYHGSTKQFNAFKLDKIGSMSGDKSGFYFTNKRKIAKDYYSKETGSVLGNLKLIFHIGNEYKSSVYDVFLNSKNPYIIKVSDKEYITREQIIKEAKEQGYDSVLFNNVIDGPTIRQDVRIVFNPNQIKSATDNIGTFSTTNDDVRYRLVDEGDSDNVLKMRRDVQKFLDNFSITIKDINEFGGEEKLFDALNRTINIRSAEDISEGVGEAIAFMMQHNVLMSQIISAKLMSESTIGSKSIRRSLRKRGDTEKFSSISDLDPELKGRLIKEVGQDIAVQLRNFYNVEPIKSEPKSLLSKLWRIIEEFFDKITPLAKARFRVLHNYTKNIVNSIALNDPSIIRATDTKPGTTDKAARVNIAQALQKNDYERSIIEFLNSKSIALAGSASIALEGTLYRPEENPLHDIDFNAASYSKEELDNVLREHFPNIEFIREINDGAEATTETYLVLDREFTTKPLKGKSSSIVELYDISGNLIGQYVGSELSLKDGIRGKFLDFFLGKKNNKYVPKVYNINDKPYLVSDYRNAFTAKITWARPKDIFDYNRFNYNEDFKLLQEQKIAQRKRIREKFKNARIIWGHPAIGKTTYLERNQDILEWDKEVNPKRFKFIRDQIDLEHKLDPTSREYKNLQKDYMTNWKMHPEYIKFMTNEWEALKERAIKENKRLFASPLPLLEIGADDFDLVINMPEKAFIERNTERGSTMLSTLDWKQALNDELVKIDPDKVITTDKYFSDFIRENLGATWGTLTDEEIQSLTLRGWTEEMFNSVSQIERDHLLKCS